MFKSATIRLTLAYLGITMVISLFFSTILYYTSVNGLQEGLHRQVRVLEELPRFDSFPGRPNIQAIYQEQVALGKRRIISNLFYTNILILTLAGIGSYILARKTLEPIEKAHIAQSRFAADASHELRTPLTAIQTETEVGLRNSQLTIEESKKLLRSNLEEAKKLRGLAEGLLSLSRYQDAHELSLDEVSIQDVISDAQEHLSAIINQSGASIKMPKNDALLRGDYENLVSLFKTLIENAIKYSKDSPEIEVVIKKQAKHVLVRVGDRGIGIKGVDLPHIFDRFYRADNSRSKQTEGYGLGLSIAKQIVEWHKGTIFARSIPGKGTQITVRLPL
jgi:two-component system, OmpR family, sensor histidine kinase CiaH